jgi:hypothetical protein
MARAEPADYPRAISGDFVLHIAGYAAASVVEWAGVIRRIPNAVESTVLR